MHIKKAYIYGCEIYFDGRKYCVHHPKESGHHKADSMEDAFEVAKQLGLKYPVPVVEDNENEEVAEEVCEDVDTADE